MISLESLHRMAWTARALSICLSIPNVASIPLLAASNITLPDNVTNHGEPNLLCTPSTGYTVFSFMLANYVMHAATTQTFPGESPFHQLLTFVTALLFPAAGVSRGLNTIARGILVTVNQKHGDLQKAAAAGALCMVVRTENWRPVIGHAIHGAIAHRCVCFGSVDMTTSDSLFPMQIHFLTGCEMENIPTKMAAQPSFISGVAVHRRRPKRPHIRIFTPYTRCSESSTYRLRLCMRSPKRYDRVSSRRPYNPHLGVSQQRQDHRCHLPNHRLDLYILQCPSRSDKAVWIRVVLVDCRAVHYHVRRQPSRESADAGLFFRLRRSLGGHGRARASLWEAI